MMPPIDPQRWDEIQATFDALVDLDPEERSTRLAALGVTDPALHVALESLLGADAAGVPRLAPLDAAFFSPATPARDPLNLVGRAVSHFHVLDPLGAGGMGVVYRGEDTRLNRAVALKFLLPQYSLDAAAKARFLQEAHSAAALDHPNVCTIHEVGESDDGRLFIAMALYSGETLKARLAREGPLPVDVALAIARQIMQGLACAHAAGIVHRDLKPGNMMLLPDGTVKILDFGLAKMRDQSLSGSSARLGTIAYMAPEQIRGEVVDARTDLWALGVVLYEMLTGRQPFAGEYEAAIAHAILYDEPAPVTALRPEIPAAAEEMVRTLLEKNPSRRFEHTDLVLNALAATRPTDEPSRLLRHSWSRRMSAMYAWLRRRPKTSAVMVVSLAAVGFVASTGLIARKHQKDGFGDVPTERSVAVLPFDNLSTDKENDFLAGGLQDAVITQLAGIADLHVIARQSVRGYANTDKPLRRIGEELGVGRIVEASVQKVGGRVRVTAQLSNARTDQLLWAKQYEREGLDLLTLQSEIALAIAEALQANLTPGERQRLTQPPTRNAEAYNFYLKGREYQQRSGVWGELRAPHAAEALYRQAVALDPSFALAHAGLAQAYGDLYSYYFEHTPIRREQMRTEAEAALRLNPDLPEGHLAMGRYWHVGDDFARALAEYSIARRGMPNDADLEGFIADVHSRQGRWEEALVEFQRSANLDPRNGGKTLALAVAYTVNRRYAEAARTWDFLIAINPDNYGYRLERAWFFVRTYGATDSMAAFLRSLPPDWKTSGAGARTGAELALLERRPADALAAIAALRPETVDSNDYGNMSYLILMRGQAHIALGDTAQALADYETARGILERAGVAHPDDAHIHADLGIVYAAMGRKSDAIREARQAMSMSPLPKGAMEAPPFAEHAAQTYAAIGEIDSALALLQQLETLPPSFFLGRAMLRLDPVWDPLRRDPRFQRLLKHHERD